jgi:hypothetical protein
MMKSSGRKIGEEAEKSTPKNKENRNRADNVLTAAEALRLKTGTSAEKWRTEKWSAKIGFTAEPKP